MTTGEPAGEGSPGAEEIQAYAHCATCRTRRQTERLEAGLTRTGLRVQCKKHGMLEHYTPDELRDGATGSHANATEIHSFAHCLKCVDRRESSRLEAGRTPTGYRFQCGKHGLIFHLTEERLRDEVLRGSRCGCCPGGMHRS